MGTIEREYAVADREARYRDGMPVAEYEAMMARALDCPADCGCRGSQEVSNGMRS